MNWLRKYGLVLGTLLVSAIAVGYTWKSASSARPVTQVTHDASVTTRDASVARAGDVPHWWKHDVDERVEEPSGFPAFQIFQEIYGLENPPRGSSCRWVRRDHNTPERPELPWYTPEAFLNGGPMANREAIEQCGFPAITSWADVLKGALGRFANVHRNYSREGWQNWRTQLGIAYGMLSVSSYSVGSWLPPASADFTGRVMQEFWHSPTLIQRAYEWSMPHVVSVWRHEMIQEDRTTYLDILRHGREYLAHFDEQRETEYLHRLERGECTNPLTDRKSLRWGEMVARPGFPASGCTHLFTSHSPDGSENRYRKLEAFFYRRVRDGVPASLILLYLNMVLEELERPIN